MTQPLIMEHHIIGDVKMPYLTLGTSPFIGAGQFGHKAREYYKRFAMNPENVTKSYCGSC